MRLPAPGNRELVDCCVADVSSASYGGVIIMTNKSLILLGVVTALAMAGGLANAAPCPQSPETISAFESALHASGGSCTFGLTTFEGFTFHDLSGDTIRFSIEPLSLGALNVLNVAAPPWISGSSTIMSIAFR